jgi:hypothetical protein
MLRDIIRIAIGSVEQESSDIVCLILEGQASDGFALVVEPNLRIEAGENEKQKPRRNRVSIGATRGIAPL